MRLDKYLKVSRIIKRRTVANEACGENLVSVNGKAVKKNYILRQGDRVELTLPEPVPDKAQPQDIPLDIVYEDDSFQ